MQYTATQILQNVGVELFRASESRTQRSVQKPGQTEPRRFKCVTHRRNPDGKDFRENLCHDSGQSTASRSGTPQVAKRVAATRGRTSCLIRLPNLSLATSRSYSV